MLSLAGLPILLFSWDNLLASSFLENLMQAVVQGALTGAGATYLFARAVVLLGAGRAVLFPSLVPPFTLLVGFLALGEVPSVSQLIGLVGGRRRLPADAEGVMALAFRSSPRKRGSGDPGFVELSWIPASRGNERKHYAALRLAKNSPIRSSARRMFSVELA